MGAPRWQPGETAWAVGSRFVVARPALLGGERDYEGTVQSIAEGRLLVCELRPTTGVGPLLVESLRLDATPSGSSVALTVSAHGPLAMLWRGKLQSNAQRQLDALHRELAPAERRL